VSNVHMGKSKTKIMTQLITVSGKRFDWRENAFQEQKAHCSITLKGGNSNVRANHV